ncbi:MAG TPA: histidine phosphatase family protein [Methylomirabilota bacterium]|jgi:broad specificity phosphatase PhoE|nr:histidine phosphatase family protein [Methylomirabilota bacterium]
MSLRVFVVRHGATDWSRERRFAGWRDVPLSDEGRRQCEAVAQALAATAAAAVYASPLERTRGSAEVIAKPHRLSVQLADAFREMGFGTWEGLTRPEVAARFPSEWDAWCAPPASFTPPGGEALGAVAERVAGGLEDLKSDHDGETVILVTHAVVARLIVLAAIGLGPERLWSIDASPGGISELEYRPDWVTVHRMNTVAHLSGTGALA